MVAPTVIEWEGQNFDSSSLTMAEASTSMPTPPYSSGQGTPNSPSSAILATLSQGKRLSRSYSAATGAISFSANSRTVARSMRCSSVRYRSSTLLFSSITLPSTVHRLPPTDFYSLPSTELYRNAGARSLRPGAGESSPLAPKYVQNLGLLPVLPRVAVAFSGGTSSEDGRSGNGQSTLSEEV